MDFQSHLRNLTIISCPKPVLIDTLQTKPKHRPSFTSLPSYNILTNGLSIWKTFSWSFKDLWTNIFIIAYLNITKIFHLIEEKNLLAIFYATVAPGFWTLQVLILLKMCLLVFRKCTVNSDIFLLQQMLVLIPWINPVFLQEKTAFH